MRPAPFLRLVAPFLAALPLGAALAPQDPEPAREAPAAETQEPTMQLGAFSVSLTVKDLAASRAFYEKLGFTTAGGVAEQNWLILRSGTTTIGLFQGMFDKNMLTFNPGWDAGAQPLERFDDVRAIQAHLLEQGLEPQVRADPASSGPAHLVLVDPDGNPILIDQHVPKPKPASKTSR